MSDSIVFKPCRLELGGGCGMEISGSLPLLDMGRVQVAFFGAELPETSKAIIPVPSAVAFFGALHHAFIALDRGEVSFPLPNFRANGQVYSVVLRRQGLGADADIYCGGRPYFDAQKRADVDNFRLWSFVYMHKFKDMAAQALKLAYAPYIWAGDAGVWLDIYGA